ncbi:MAG: hypothetical protein KAG97_02870 [Victivallales bacterium]|nr:hypothetical protein [Victivallales bacterium]
MTSKERILAAMRQEEVDHLPCSIYFNTNLKVDGYDLRDWRERTRLGMDLGTDPVVPLGVPDTPHPEVRTEAWLEDAPDGGDRILFKKFKTPSGTLRIGVRYSDDWTSGMNVPWGDITASNMYEPLIKSPDDVDAFEYIWNPPRSDDSAAVLESRQEILDFADNHSLPIQGYAGFGLAMLMFTMGAENAIMFAIDHPEAFKRLAEMDSRANIERIRLSAEAGVDFVKRFGGYEQTNFYNPTIFREVVLPLLKAEVAAAHEAGIMIFYRVVTGMEPLLEDIASAGFDCIEGGEPCLSKCSLEMWNEAFSGKSCSWTGVSTPVLLGGKDPDAIRTEVRHCVEVFGGKGYILGVTNSIRNHFPWKNTLAMIDEWEKVR